MEKSKTKWVLMMESLPKTWIGKVLLHSCPLHIKIDRWIQRFRYIQDQDVETSGPLWRGTDIPHFRSLYTLYTLTSQKKSVVKIIWFLKLTLFRSSTLKYIELFIIPVLAWGLLLKQKLWQIRKSTQSENK